MNKCHDGGQRLPVYGFALFAGRGAKHRPIIFFTRQDLPAFGLTNRQEIEMIAAG